MGPSPPLGTYCVDGEDSRTIYCPSGYDLPSTLLAGSALFSGCTGKPFFWSDASCIFQKFRRKNSVIFSFFLAVDMCARYGPSAPTTFILSCVWSATVPNQRTVTCQPGFWAMGPGQDESKNSITITGAVAFAGCKRALTKSKQKILMVFLEIDDCLAFGMGPSPPAGTYCVDGLNSRTIYCPLGYTPSSITLAPTDTFSGCQSTQKKTEKIGALKCLPFPNFPLFFAFSETNFYFLAQNMCVAYGPTGPYPTTTVESPLFLKDVHVSIFFHTNLKFL